MKLIHQFHSDISEFDSCQEKIVISKGTLEKILTLKNQMLAIFHR